MSFEPSWTTSCCFYFYPSSLVPGFASLLMGHDDRYHHDEEKSLLVNEHGLEVKTASCCSSFVSQSFDDCLIPSSALIGNAWDLILTHSTRDSKLVSCSDAVFCFDKQTGLKAVTPHAKSVVLEVESLSGSPIRFPIKNHKIQSQEDSVYPMEERRSSTLSSFLRGSQKPSGDAHSQTALATLVSSLKPGGNRARYLLLHDDDILAVAPIRVFLCSEQDRVIVVDVDGTVTKSNVRGVVDTVITESYHHCHSGVCRFFTNLLKQLQVNDLQRAQLVYLSSRPIRLANCTKKFIHELRQSKGKYALPDGPLLCFPGSLSRVLKMELWTHSVHEFKTKTLKDQVVRPFTQVGVTDSVLMAGFGNQASDMKAYHQAGCDKIYLIDKQSKIYSLDRYAHLRDTSPPRHHWLSSSPNHEEDHVRSKGLVFDGYSDVNLVDHISHNPHFTHYQDFFC